MLVVTATGWGVVPRYTRELGGSRFLWLWSLTFSKREWDNFPLTNWDHPSKYNPWSCNSEFTPAPESYDGWKITLQGTSTYLTLGKGRHFARKCLGRGYVSSQEGIFLPFWGTEQLFFLVKMLVLECRTKKLFVFLWVVKHEMDKPILDFYVFLFHRNLRGPQQSNPP